MKKTIYTLLSLMLLSVTSCKKDGDNNNNNQLDPCEEQNFGWISVSNTSSNPYGFYVNSQFVANIQGNSFLNDHQLSAGNNVQLYAVQLSGYILWPTEVNTTLNVVECSDYSWVIP